MKRKKVSQSIRRVAIGLAAISLIASSLVVPLPPAHTDALAGADFKPGRIIDNAIFYNNGAMSVQQIQDFLNTKVPSCDTNGDIMYSGGQTRAQFSASQGHPAPFTCLRDYYQNTTNGADNYGGKSIPAGAISAAQIIYNAAQQYTISPQVILVILQKESGIVTDDWAWDSQYKIAMGYACPDTADCDAAYFGFYNQVNSAAQQFHRYATNPNGYNFLPGINNTIQYNPNSSCGSSQVYIENQATASLYNYTPYQPNRASLDNLYGTAPPCGAYGNRNFWRIFNLWFGSTLTDDRGVNFNEAQDRIQPISYNGGLYVFYYDAFRRALRMGFTDNSTPWQFSVIDGESDSSYPGSKDASVGSSLTAAVFNNQLHVFYYDKTNGNIRYGKYDGNAWRFLNLDGDPGSYGGRDSNLGTNPSVAVYRNTLQLFYYDVSAGNLRHAWTSGSTWSFETLDGEGGYSGRLNSNLGTFSAVTTYRNSIQLFYYDKQNAKLRHAWTSPTQSWRFENLDGDGGVNGRIDGNVGISPLSTTLGSSLQLFYYDKSHTNLRHAWTNPDHGWQFEALDGQAGASVSNRDGDVGQTISVAVQGTSTLHLFYYDTGNDNLRHAWTSPVQPWKFNNIDGDPGSLGGQNGDLGIHSGATPYGTGLQLYYYNRTTGNFRHAWTGASGPWNFENLGPTVIY